MKATLELYINSLGGIKAYPTIEGATRPMTAQEKMLIDLLEVAADAAKAHFDKKYHKTPEPIKR